MRPRNKREARYRIITYSGNLVTRTLTALTTGVREYIMLECISRKIDNTISTMAISMMTINTSTSTTTY